MEICEGNCQKVCINISGSHFQTTFTTLQQIRDTRLSNLSPDDIHYDSDKKEYFFDRNPCLFPFILDAYRNGKVHLPNDVCMPLFLEELEYWGLSHKAIASCCLKNYYEYQNDQKSLKKLIKTIQSLDKQVEKYQVESQSSCYEQLKFHIWLFLVDPRSSVAARVWSLSYLAMVTYSIFVVTMSTHPYFRKDKISDEVCKNNTGPVNPKKEMYCKSELIPILRYLNFTCDFVFVIELIVRLVVWPKSCKFFSEIINIIDSLAIVIMGVMSAVSIAVPHFWLQQSNILAVYIIIAACCCLRTLRILKIMQHNRGLRVLQLAMQVSARELSLILLLLIIGVIIFATLVYYAEFHDPKSDFQNIPEGFWWSLVTMTTVGFGDMVPRTLSGRLVGALCAFSGILMLSLTVPVVAGNFHHFYHLLSLSNTAAKFSTNTNTIYNKIYKNNENDL